MADLFSFLSVVLFLIIGCLFIAAFGSGILALGAITSVFGLIVLWILELTGKIKS